MIRKGDTVRIKPQWQDEGDFRFRWVALSDENHGWLDIGPVDTGLPYPPIYSVTTDMLEGAPRAVGFNISRILRATAK